MARHETLPPSAACLSASMRDIGYSLETAIADLVDNSISAGARQIDIVCDMGATEPRVHIIDDGLGMCEEGLLEAMRHGTDSARKQRTRDDLGRFGLGLKTAYKGGYRANIVAYTLAMLSLIARDSRHHINFLQVWQDQRPSSSMMEAMKIVAAHVHDVIRKEGEKFGNVSGWCKKEGYWDSLRPEKEKIRSALPKDFLDSLVSDEDQQCMETTARKSQKMDNGIEAQQRVMEIGSTAWTDITHALRKANRLGIKEEKLLRVAVAIPKMVPTEKQSLGLLEVLDKARTEGLLPTSLR